MALSISLAQIRAARPYHNRYVDWANHVRGSEDPQPFVKLLESSLSVSSIYWLTRCLGKQDREVLLQKSMPCLLRRAKERLAKVASLPESASTTTQALVVRSGVVALEFWADYAVKKACADSACQAIFWANVIAGIVSDPAWAATETGDQGLADQEWAREKGTASEEAAQRVDLERGIEAASWLHV